MNAGAIIVAAIIIAAAIFAASGGRYETMPGEAYLRIDRWTGKPTQLCVANLGGGFCKDVDVKLLPSK